MIISRTYSWAEHTARVGDVRKPRRITLINLKEAGCVCVYVCVCVDCNYLAQNKNSCRTLIFVLKNLRFPLTTG